MKTTIQLFLFLLVLFLGNLVPIISLTANDTKQSHEYSHDYTELMLHIDPGRSI